MNKLKRVRSGNKDSHDASSSQKANESRFFDLLSLLKAIAWPLVIMFVVVSFWSPLHQLAARLSPMVDNIDSVSVGGVHFTVSKEFMAKRAPEAVRIAARKLTPEAIKYILEEDRAVHRTTRQTLNGVERELIAATLCSELDYKALDSLKQEDPTDKTEYHAGMDCGSKYEDVRVFLIELIPALVRQASAT